MPTATEDKPKVIKNALFAEDVKRADSTDGEEGRDDVSNYLSTDEGSGLHSDSKESEFEAYMRINNRIYGQMLPAKQKVDIEAQEMMEAYEGVMNNKKIFPFVFMFVDSKLAAILATRPKIVFDSDTDKGKLPYIERMYEHYTSDVDDGVDEEVVNYIWHLYNELFGWAVKRIWHDVDMSIEHIPQTVEDERGNMVYEEDGFVKIEYERKQWVQGKMKQRVYEPDKVAVTPNITFQHEIWDIVFIEDMAFDEWSQKYMNNPMYENTKKVRAGQYYTFNPATYAAEDETTNQLVLYETGIGLEEDKVRTIEYYSRTHDELYVMFNGHKGLHMVNPTPPVNGKKGLPFAMLQNRARVNTPYWKAEGKLVEPIIVMWQRLMNARALRAELASSPVVLTDMPSGFAPKSFKVRPGAHWRGMKGRVESFNLGGADTGEVKDYINELRDLGKGITGVDFDRFIAEPDPTAQQQIAREAASKLRTDKDASLQEKQGYLRSAQVMVAGLMFHTPIPDIASLEELDEDERKAIEDIDKLDDGKNYFKYPKIPTKNGLMFVEQYIKKDDEMQLIPYLGHRTQKDIKDKAVEYFFARDWYVRTKAPIKVRVVSNRSRSTSRALRREEASELMLLAFETPPKNQFEIEQALQKKEQPPEPVYYLNREKAISEKVDSLGFDVKEMTSQDNQRGKALDIFKSVFGEEAPTLSPKDQEPPSAVFKKKLNLQGDPNAVPSEQNAAPPPPEVEQPVQ